MKTPSCQILVALAFAAATLSAAPVAQAALGGDVSSIQADQVHMKAALRIQTAQDFTVHELHKNGGAVVKEFISPGGRVFAVSWSGPVIPDLRQLLGNYFDQFTQATVTQGRRARHAPLKIEQNGLVVQTGGHMRAFFGKAYLTDALPATVRAESIR